MIQIAAIPFKYWRFAYGREVEEAEWGYTIYHDFNVLMFSITFIFFRVYDGHDIDDPNSSDNLNMT